MDYLKRKISLLDGTVNKCILMGLSYCPDCEAPSRNYWEGEAELVVALQRKIERKTFSKSLVNLFPLVCPPPSSNLRVFDQKKEKRKKRKKREKEKKKRKPLINSHLYPSNYRKNDKNLVDWDKKLLLLPKIQRLLWVKPFWYRISAVVT